LRQRFVGQNHILFLVMKESVVADILGLIPDGLRSRNQVAFGSAHKQTQFTGYASGAREPRWFAFFLLGGSLGLCFGDFGGVFIEHFPHCREFGV